MMDRIAWRSSGRRNSVDGLTGLGDELLIRISRTYEGILLYRLTLAEVWTRRLSGVLLGFGSRITLCDARARFRLLCWLMGLSTLLRGCC